MGYVPVPGPPGPQGARGEPGRDAGSIPVRLAVTVSMLYLATSLLCLALLALSVHRALRAAPASTASRSWDPPVLPPSALPEHLGNGDRPDLPGLPV